MCVTRILNILSQCVFARSTDVMFCLALSSRFFHRLCFTRALILRCRGVDVIPAHCGLCGSFPAHDPFDALVSFFLKVDVTLEALSEAHLLLKGISGAYVKRCIECVSPQCFLYRFRSS